VCGCRFNMGSCWDLLRTLKQVLFMFLTTEVYSSCLTLVLLRIFVYPLNLAMGPVVHLWTRAMYRDICLAPWDREFGLGSANIFVF